MSGLGKKGKSWVLDEWIDEVLVRHYVTYGSRTYGPGILKWDLGYRYIYIYIYIYNYIVNVHTDDSYHHGVWYHLGEQIWISALILLGGSRWLWKADRSYTSSIKSICFHSSLRNLQTSRSPSTSFVRSIDDRTKANQNKDQNPTTNPNRLYKQKNGPWIEPRSSTI